jgi:hypothetical protein
MLRSCAQNITFALLRLLLIIYLWPYYIINFLNGMRTLETGFKCQSEELIIIF